MQTKLFRSFIDSYVSEKKKLDTVATEENEIKNIMNPTTSLDNSFSCDNSICVVASTKNT